MLTIWPRKIYPFYLPNFKNIAWHKNWFKDKSYKEIYFFPFWLQIIFFLKGKKTLQNIFLPRKYSKKEKKSETKSRSISRLPRAGLEPARPWSHQILSLACLPVPSPRHIWLFEYSELLQKIKRFYLFLYFARNITFYERNQRLNFNNFEIFFLFLFFNFLTKNQSCWSYNHHNNPKYRENITKIQSSCTIIRKNKFSQKNWK